jgi:hypothetical protein
MQICQTLGPNLLRRESANDGKGESSFEFVQGLLRKSRTGGRAKTTLGQIEHVTFTQAPGVECRFRQDYAQGVSDATDSDFHVDIITGYNI